MARPMSEEVKRLMAENPGLSADGARKRLARKGDNTPCPETDNRTEKPITGYNKPQDNTPSVLLKGITRHEEITGQEYASPHVDILSDHALRLDKLETLVAHLEAAVKSLQDEVVKLVSLSHSGPPPFKKPLDSMPTTPSLRECFSPAPRVSGECEPILYPKDGVGKKKGKGSIPGTSSAAGGTREEEFSE